MYNLHDFYDDCNPSKFIKILSTKWDELHNTSDIFRYKINKLEKRLVDEQYVVQLNPDRRDKRRAPEEINNVLEPFDANKFNFTKVSSEEILFSIEDTVSNIHTVIINVSPITRYHSLLCPWVYKRLPQVVTLESLALAIEIVFVARDRNLRILFNSLCAFASVNHLHYHIFMESNDFFVEKVEWRHIKDGIFKLDESYPVPAFCFKVQKKSILQNCQEIYRVLDHLLKNSIAHNILLTRRNILVDDDTVYVIVWPRRSTTGAKQFSVMNVAVLELSGWFPVYDFENYMKLNAEDLENELLKWNIDFDNMCEDIKCL